MSDLFMVQLDNAEILKEIDRIREYAEEHVVDFETLSKMVEYGKPGYDGPIPAGMNPDNTMKIYDITGIHFYNIAYSIEQMGKLWVRHFSASIDTGGEPQLSFISLLLPLFKFQTNDYSKLLVQHNRPAIHVIEPTEMTWAEFEKQEKL